MVKTSKKARAGGKKNGTSKPARIPRGPRDSSADLLSGAINMVLDPCSSNLKPSAYSGQSGIVQRFSTTIVYNGADTNRIFTWVPGRFRSWSAGLATTSTTATPAYGTIIPAASFLAANTQNARVLGACVDVSYLGKELDRSGYIALGVVPADTLESTTATTCDRLAARLAVKGRVPVGDFHIKWYPSSVDNEYVDINDGLPGGDDFGIANALTFVYMGAPAGAQFAVTLTAIVEWNPKQDNGIVVNTTSAVSVPDAVSKINSSLASAGRWWTNLGDISTNAMHTISSVYSGASNTMKLVKGVSNMALMMA